MINMDASGCGNGKYLQVNPSIFKVGSDRCAASVDVARRKDHEVSVRFFFLVFPALRARSDTWAMTHHPLPAFWVDS